MSTTHRSRSGQNLLDGERRRTARMIDETKSLAAALASCSATQRKWASFVLLGPLLPSIFAILLIVVGRAIVKGDPIEADGHTACGQPLDIFIEAAIWVSYAFLAVFSWSFLGFKVTFSFWGWRRWLLRPFYGLVIVAVQYMFWFTVSLGIWIFGTWAVLEDTRTHDCASRVPYLYSLSVATVVIYWLGVFFALVTIATMLYEQHTQDPEETSFDTAESFSEESLAEESDTGLGDITCESCGAVQSLPGRSGHQE
ncbi:unnamed protein product [Ascophyllum nodosum]